MKAGHARERGKDRWELRWRDAAKRLHTETVSASSQRAAEVELSKRIAQAEGGIVANAPARMTLGDYLPQWLASQNLRPLTRQNYASTVRTYLAPDLGHVRLKELSASAIRAAFMKWLGEGAARSSLRQVKTVLQSCLRSALLDDLIGVNPMDKLRARKGEKNPLPIGMPPKAIPVPSAKIAELLAADGGHYQIAIVLMVAAGIRRGESLGLRWRNVDIEGARIKIVEQRVPLTGGARFGDPKSASSVRTIKLPSEAVDALKAHRNATRERLFANGYKLTDDTTVACNDLGEPLDPNAFGSWARRRGFKLHNLRHAHLSKLVNSGVPIAAVSARAGHSTIATTLGTYVHAEGTDDDKAAAVAGGFW